MFFFCWLVLFSYHFFLRYCTISYVISIFEPKDSYNGSFLDWKWKQLLCFVWSHNHTCRTFTFNWSDVKPIIFITVIIISQMTPDLKKKTKQKTTGWISDSHVLIYFWIDHFGILVKTAQNRIFLKSYFHLFIY